MTTEIAESEQVGANGQAAPSFQTFRWADGVGLPESGAMVYNFAGDTQRENVGLLGQAGSESGTETRVLFAGPGFSLVHIWFKSGFPLPLHSHDSDCLYYIVAGSVRMGTEVLRSGDGFFVPSDVPYTYVAGDEGVELLEFRNRDVFDVKFPSTRHQYWAGIAGKMRDRASGWADEPRPVAGFPDF